MALVVSGKNNLVTGVIVRTSHVVDVHRLRGPRSSLSLLRYVSFESSYDFMRC